MLGHACDEIELRTGAVGMELEVGSSSVAWLVLGLDGLTRSRH